MTIQELFNTIQNFSISGSSVSSTVIFLFIVMAIITAVRWQKSQKLDFSDLITYPNNNKVSLTKFIQLLGGIVSSWVIIKMTIQGTIDWEILGLYFAYVGGVESYSKYLRSKYGPADKSEIDKKDPK